MAQSAPPPAPLALVTGASSGIGRAFAERFSHDGFGLVLVARRRERLEELCHQIKAAGGRAEFLVADLATPEGLETVERRARAGEVTMLVNNAGFQNYGPFASLDIDLAEAQIRVHVTAVVRLSRAVLPAMIAHGSGAIINISSMLAFSAGLELPFLPKRATYAAGKAFVNAFTETLSGELTGSGVKVQALCPGVVRTEFHDVDGKPLLRPNVPIMEPEDLVAASLAALALGDVICSPALVERNLIDNERQARHAVFAAGRGAKAAPRYAERTEF